MKLDSSRLKDNALSSYAVGFLLSLLLLLYRLIIQPIITANNGLGFDSRYYFQMAIDPHSSVPLPFSLRIGLPLLVHYLPGSDILLKFKIVSILFSVLFSYICFIGISKFSSSKYTIIVVWLLICATEVSPIPFSVWLPMNPETLPNLLLLILVILTLSTRRINNIFLLFLFTTGTICRENFPMYMAVLLLNITIETESNTRKFLVRNVRENHEVITNIWSAFLGSLIGLLAIFLYTGNSPISGKAGIFIATLTGQSLIDLIASITIIFGPLILLYCASRIINISKGLTFGAKPVLYLVTLILIFISLGGGADTERFFYWVLIVLVFEAIPLIENTLHFWKPQYSVISIALILFLQRFFIPISPEYIAGCGIKTFFFGNATFMGSWTNICGPIDTLKHILAYLLLFGSFELFFTLDTIYIKRPSNIEQTNGILHPE